MTELPNVTRNNDGSVSLVWSTDKQTVLSISRELLEHMGCEINEGKLAALTEAECEAVAWATRLAASFPEFEGMRNHAAALRGLLERLG
jgi:hypothetical protein